MNRSSLVFLISVAVWLPVLVVGCSCDGKVALAQQHIDAGNGYLQDNKLKEALAEFEKALAIAPHHPPIHLSIGSVYTRQGRFTKAVEKFRYVIEQDPKSAEAYTLWAAILQRQGRDEEAIRKYEAALESVPEHLTAANHLGLLLVGRESERARGIRLLEGAVKARPGNPSVLHNLGWAYLQAKRYPEAYNLLQRAVAATHSSSPAYEERVANLELAGAQLPRRVATPDMPNIVLFVIDTLRADHLSSYGYPRKTTPHIDAVAERGVLFENAVSQAPWTAPSIASLFTGLYPSVHGLDGGIRWGPGQRSAGGTLPFAIQKVLSSSQVTLAEGLRRHGYQTAGFVSNIYVNSIFGFSQGFELYNDEHRGYSKEVDRAKRRAEDTNKYVFEWLDAEPKEPFFLLVHYNDPHWPYNPPPPFGEEYVAGYQGGLTPERSSAVVETQGKPITNLSDDDVAYLIGLYDGETAYVDTELGRVLAKVRSLGLDRPLLTVITSDHGEEFLDHGSASHGYTLYEEMIRVPLIFQYPGRLEPARVPAQVRLIDVLPSIFGLVGVPDGVPPGVQGQSLVPLLDGESAAGAQDAFSEATYAGDKKSIRTAQGLKLIYSFVADEAMLFDLNADPREQKSLVDGKSSPGEPLKQRLGAWIESNLAAGVALYGEDKPDQEVVLDEETRARLESLGYIQ
ncbi:MAG: sulfatase-like hydrolase/transferase [Acidobacteriota bacterium]|nr:sulfatase-like hydrolase/transferase [Acidobacteriota bacterium]